MGLMVATKAFFKLLTNSDLSASFDDFANGKLSGPPAIAAPVAAEATESKSKSQPAPEKQKAAPKQGRSDAISLLAALQREARWLDLVNESLDEYSDAQIGGAARDVLRDSKTVLERMFALQPLTDAEDGAPIETPSAFDPAEYRLTGNVTGDAPFKGALTHHGWKATRCEVPTFSGSESAAMIVAPVEIEIK